MSSEGAPDSTLVNCWASVRAAITSTNNMNADAGIIALENSGIILRNFKGLGVNCIGSSPLSSDEWNYITPYVPKAGRKSDHKSPGGWGMRRSVSGMRRVVGRILRRSRHVPGWDLSKSV